MQENPDMVNNLYIQRILPLIEGKEKQDILNALRELKLSFVTIESPVRVFTTLPLLSTK